MAGVTDATGSLAGSKSTLRHVVNQTTVAILGYSASEMRAKSPIHPRNIRFCNAVDWKTVHQSKSSPYAEFIINLFDYILTCWDRKVRWVYFSNMKPLNLVKSREEFVNVFIG